MDLFGILKSEINRLNLTDEYEIAYFVYIRIGQMFDYDATYVFDYDNRGEELEKVRLDIHNVQPKKLICFSWAHLYTDMLNALGIFAKFDETKSHARVLFKANGSWFCADLTKGIRDISNIKYGFSPTEIFSEDVYMDNYEIDREIGFYKGISPLECFYLLEKELKRDCLDKEEKIYRIFKFTEYYMNFDRENFGFISTKNFVKLVINTISNYKYECSDFVDLEKEDYVRIYSVKRQGKIVFFVVKEDDKGFFRIKESPIEVIEEIVNNYQIDENNVFSYDDHEGKNHMITHFA